MDEASAQPAEGFVFVSHSSSDKPAADAACAMLENRGIRCWIAPRDVVPGTDWASAIVEAIDHCRVFVLIFSSHSNASPQIRNEMAQAVNRAVPIIPVRIEDVVPTKAMAYFMGTVHWLDALTPPLESHLPSSPSRSRRCSKSTPRPLQRRSKPFRRSGRARAQQFAGIRRRADCLAAGKPGQS